MHGLVYHIPPPSNDTDARARMAALLEASGMIEEALAIYEQVGRTISTHPITHPINISHQHT